MPFGSRGAGAFRSGLPSALRGTSARRCGGHCAASATGSTKAKNGTRDSHRRKLYRKPEPIIYQAPLSKQASEVMLSVTDGLLLNQHSLGDRGQNRGRAVSKPPDLVQGTLDLLLLEIIALEPLHGWAIAQRLLQVSNDELQVTTAPSTRPAQARADRPDYRRVEDQRPGAACQVLRAHPVCVVVMRWHRTVISEQRAASLPRHRRARQWR